MLLDLRETHYKMLFWGNDRILTLTNYWDDFRARVFHAKQTKENPACTHFSCLSVPPTASVSVFNFLFLNVFICCSNICST